MFGIGDIVVLDVGTDGDADGISVVSVGMIGAPAFVGELDEAIDRKIDGDSDGLSDSPGVGLSDGLGDDGTTILSVVGWLDGLDEGPVVGPTVGTPKPTRLGLPD